MRRGSELVRIAPGLGRPVDRPAGVPGDVGDGREGGGLSRTGCAFDDDIASAGGRGADRVRLLGAERLPLFGQHAEVLVDQLRGNLFGGSDGEFLREPFDVPLAVELRLGGEDAGVGEVGLDVGPFAPAVEFEHVGAFEDLRCDGLDLLRGHQAGQDGGDALHEVVDAEDGLGPGEVGGNSVQEVLQFLHVLVGDPVLGNRFESGLDVLDERASFEFPADWRARSAAPHVAWKAGCSCSAVRRGPRCLRWLFRAPLLPGRWLGGVSTSASGARGRR